MLPSALTVSTTSLLVSLLSTSLGRLLNVSVLEETNMGVRPGGPDGNLGGVMERPEGLFVGLLVFCLLLNC